METKPTPDILDIAIAPQRITSLDDPRVALYRSLRDAPALHDAERVFVAEGITATTKLLQSALDVVSVFALPKHYATLHGLLAQRRRHGALPDEYLFTAEKRLMNDIIGFHHHTGVMAVGRRPYQITMDDWTSEQLRSLPMPIVALNAVADAENMGSIIRNCAGFGVPTIIVDGEACSPYLRRAVRVSMGGIFSVNVLECSSLARVCERLRSEAGCTVVAAEMTADAVPLPQFQFPEQRFALVLGSEGFGVDASILAACDSVVSIPMAMPLVLTNGQKVEHDIPQFGHHSLNVSAASAVLLYAACAAKPANTHALE